jgi:hypothetical protein
VSVQFTSAEESDDRRAHPVAVANYSWWQRRFAQDPAIIGKKVRFGTTVYALSVSRLQVSELRRTFAGF